MQYNAYTQLLFSLIWETIVQRNKIQYEMGKLMEKKTLQGTPLLILYCMMI